MGGWALWVETQLGRESSGGPARARPLPHLPLRPPAPLPPPVPRGGSAGSLTPLCRQLGEAAQVETVSEENKGLIWMLLKQLRPGMDLSRVVLPTFVLEPRSFLSKLSDYYCHADLLSR